MLCYKLIRSNRKTIQIQVLPDKTIEVIDSFFENAPHDAKPLWFLGKSFELLSNADLAVFIGEWEKYRGCRMEHLAAIEYGIATYITAD